MAEEPSLIECETPDDAEVTNSPFSSGSEDLDGGSSIKDLPACKLRRNYYCKACAFCTINPREYLYHLRDVHHERLQIYECSECVYASRGKVKLARHLRMVHGRELLSVKVDLTKTPAVNCCVSAPVANLVSVKSADSEHSDDDVVDSMSNMCDDNTENSTTEDIEDDVTVNAESISDTPDGFILEAASEIEHVSSNKLSTVQKSIDGSRENGTLTKKFFRCSKCDYTTPIRSRYSKHVRYHSMPMIKCDICEFKTPYKWNLDRHMKNHNDDGVFKCNVCKFSSQIKQSLTVHIQNHHLPHENAGIEFTGDFTDLVPPGIEGDSLDEDAPDLECDTSIKSKFSEHDSHDEKSLDGDLSSLKINGGVSVEGDESSVARSPINNSPSFSDGVSFAKSKMERIAEEAAIAFLSPGNGVSDSKGPLSVLDQLFSKKLLSSFSAEGSTPGKAEKSFSQSPKTSSTRCQHCRHRCKSSDDLRNHLLTCQKATECSLDFVQNHVNNGKESPPSTNKVTKGIYKCPRCSFWSVSVAVFHTHWMGHLNMKPHQCSTCKYRSNWKWSVTKHIESKQDSEHLQARAVIVATKHKPGEYDIYSTEMLVASNLDCEPEENLIEQLRCSSPIRSSVDLETSFTIPPNITITPHPGNSDKTSSTNSALFGIPTPLRSVLSPESATKSSVAPNLEMLKQDPSLAAMDLTANNTAIVMPQPPPDHRSTLSKQLHGDSNSNDSKTAKKATVWRCKKCNFKHKERVAMLAHVASHSAGGPDVNNTTSSDTAPTARCPADTASSQPGRPAHGDTDRERSGVSVFSSRSPSSWSPSVSAVATSLLGSDVSISVVSRYDSESSNAKFRCDICSYTCANTDEAISAHMRHHTPQNGATYKCGLCPYYVSSHVKLVEHLAVHSADEVGESVDISADYAGSDGQLPAGFYRVGPPAQHRAEHSLRCPLCPFSTERHLLFAAHQQLHDPPASADLLHCPVCSFCAQQRPQLAQHVQLHGLAMVGEGGTATPPLLSDSATRHLADIPLVWVSRAGQFHKMYKCRQCPHVNLRKSNIQEHERMHSDRELAGLPHRCSLCNYVCVNAGVLSSHVKVHAYTLGTVHALVDPTCGDDQQLQRLCGQQADVGDQLVTSRDDESESRRVLFFCQQCPARFFHQREIDIHTRFHGLSLPFACHRCNYTSRQRPHLLAHAKVHEREYAERSRSLLTLYTVSDQYPPRQHASSPPTPQQLRVPLPPRASQPPPLHPRASVKRHACELCPARFVKEATLRYHRSLHGCDAPFRCIKCDYAVKTYGNLTQHINLHIQAEAAEAEQSDCHTIGVASESDFPMSGLDLLKRKMNVQKGAPESPRKAARVETARPSDPYYEERSGNPEFTYPTVTDRYGRERQKRYKCRKCPSAFEKREQYLKHTSLHGVPGRFTCTHCDYAVNYYPNFCNHMKRHGVPPLPMSEASHRVPMPVDAAVSNWSAETQLAAGGS